MSKFCPSMVLRAKKLKTKKCLIDCYMCQMLGNEKNGSSIDNWGNLLQ